MTLKEIARKRKSAREFKTKKVSAEKILEALDLAVQGPFAGNMNNLKFIIVNDSVVIKKIAGFCHQHWIATAPVLIVVCSDDSHLESHYGEKGRVYSRQQAGATIQTILFSLTEQKIDSCWVGGFSDELVKQQLGLPQHMEVEAIIPAGYEIKKSHIKKPKKKPVQTTIYYNKWFSKEGSRFL